MKPNKTDTIMGYTRKKNAITTAKAFFKNCFLCDFCVLYFPTASERSQHILKHFKRKSCSGCGDILVQINGEWYGKHHVNGCDKENHNTNLCPETKSEDDLLEKIEASLEFTPENVKAEPMDVEHSFTEPFTSNQEAEDEDESESKLNLTDGETPIHLEEVTVEEFKIADTSTTNSDAKVIPGTQPCPICQKLLHSKTIPRHMEFVHNRKPLKRVPCPVCKKTFNRRYMQRHMQRFHAEHVTETIEFLQCEQCGKVIKKRGYQRHLMLKHNAEKKRFICDDCGHECSSQLNLEYHKHTHQKGSDEFSLITCHICQKCLHPQSIDGHLQRVHKQSVGTLENKISCELCNKKVDKNMYLRHINSVHAIEKNATEKKTLECKECDRTFLTELGLIKHVHKDSKPFTCKYCGLRFKFRRKVEDHERSHTGERPHKCDVCDKAFIRDSTLYAHKRIHTGERPYKCTEDECGRDFMYKIDLNRHKYRAHRIYTKKFPCLLCPKVFPENKLLQTHMQTHGPVTN